MLTSNMTNWRVSNDPNSPLQKLRGEWVRDFGAAISGIARVDKRFYNDGLIIALNTIDQS